MPISAVDLFCGIGGLTHGLQLSGIPVVAGIDVENSCRYAYEQNNDAQFVLRDITQVSGDELRNYFIPNTIKILSMCSIYFQDNLFYTGRSNLAYLLARTRV